MQSGHLSPSVMDAPTVLALFFLVVFVLGLLVAPIIWLWTAGHDRKEREQTERKPIPMDTSRYTARRLPPVDSQVVTPP